MTSMGFGWNGKVSGRLIKHTEMYGYRLLIIGVAVALETGVVSRPAPLPPGRPTPAAEALGAQPDLPITRLIRNFRFFLLAVKATHKILAAAICGILLAASLSWQPRLVEYFPGSVAAHSVVFAVRCLLFTALLMLLFLNRQGLRLAGFAGLLALFCAGTFLFMEMFARAAMKPQHSWDTIFPVDDTRVEFPYIEFKGNPERFNNLGYRGPSPDTFPQPEEYRIFVLGGSTVFNGSPPVTEILQSRLIEAGHTGARVFNFGVVSSSSPMALSRVLHEIVDYHPDLVVFYNGANDISQPLHWDPRPGYPFNFIAYERNVLLRDIEEYPGIALLAYNSYLLRQLYRPYFSNKFGNLDSLQRRAGHFTDPWKRDIAATYMQSLRKTDRLGKAFGFEFLAVLQPTLHFKETIHPLEEPFISDYDTPYHQEMREIILEMSEDHDFRFTDASLLFTGDTSLIFTDDVHITQSAKEQVAAYLAAEISALLPEPLPDKDSNED